MRVDELTILSHLENVTTFVIDMPGRTDVLCYHGFVIADRQLFTRKGPSE